MCVCNYNDGIEILSRGELAPLQTINGFYKGHSIPVNEKLSELFLQLHISEKTGRGIPKIIEVYGKESIDISDDTILVTIPFNRVNKVGDKVGDKVGNKVGNKNLNISQIKVLAEIRNNPNIHPFNDGNGRMSRLLTLVLLYKSGYTVGQYVSIEKLISDTKDSYYEALQASSYGWHENENNYAPFVEYMLGIVIAAYRDFTARAKLLTEKGVSKPNRVRDIIKNTTGKITKTEIMEKCPDISQTTVQRALNDLLKSEEIIKIGGGRYTSYTWNWEKE
jgi:predicted HTH transcriptional regulator